jgi:hypothetical protein
MTCIQCRRPAVILLTRPRPQPARGEYQICVPCAVRVREEQDERVIISASSTGPHGRPMLAGTTQPHSPDRENGVAGKLAGHGRGNP